LWKIAAWAMGFSVLAYLLLAATGVWMFGTRTKSISQPSWLKFLHYILGASLVGLVLLLLAIGIVGTLGHFGSLGHSSHYVAGLVVVALVLLSGASATLIHVKPWAWSVHIGTNITLFAGLVWVSLTGWSVVQKYLP